MFFSFSVGHITCQKVQIKSEKSKVKAGVDLSQLNEKSIASGILEKAKGSATSTDNGLLEIMGFDDVTITY